MQLRDLVLPARLLLLRIDRHLREVVEGLVVPGCRVLLQLDHHYRVVFELPFSLLLLVLLASLPYFYYPRLAVWQLPNARCRLLCEPCLQP